MKTSDRPQPAERRPLKEAITEMIGFNLLMVMAGVMALSAVSRLGRDYFSQTSTPIALQLGNSALDHLGWGLGITTTVVFGCLVASAGGQVFFGSTSEEAQLRRSLGVLAELTVSAMLPVTLLAASTALMAPAQFGAVFVIVPVYFVLWVLSVQVGRFVVLERQERLKRAQKDKDWALGLLKTLRNRPRTTTWRAVLVVSAVSLAPSMALALAWDVAVGVTPLSPSLGTVSVSAATAALLTKLYVDCSAGHLTRRTTADTFANWVLPGYVTLVVIAFSILMFLASWRYGIGYLGAIVISLTFGVPEIIGVTLRPKQRRLGFVGRAAVHSARRATGRTLKNAHKTLVELDPRDEPAESDIPAGLSRLESASEHPDPRSKWQRIATIVLER